ncbi:MAG TPA: VTT domain-containing protein, partial [Acidobacteriota bacterium]|nr:VTT domain-containing protein [Acidobacteriota bacterium]
MDLLKAGDSMSKSSILKLALLLVFIAGIIYGVFFSGIDRSQFTVENLREWVKSYGALAPILLVGLYSIRPVFPVVPPLPVAIVIGAIYGTLTGTLMVIVGATLAGLFAFYLARFLGRDFVSRKAEKAGRLKDIKKKIESGGWATVMVARFANVPWDVVSFASGLSDIKVRDFFIGTVIPAVPLSFIAVYFGAVFSRLDAFSDLLRPGPLSALGVFAAGIVIPIWIKKRLDPADA